MNEVEHQDRYGYVRGMVGQDTNRRAYLARLIVSNESQRRQRHGHRLLHLFIEAATTAGDTTMYTQLTQIEATISLESSPSSSMKVSL